MEPKSQSSGRALRPPFGFIRSLSPTRHFHSSSSSSSSSSAVNFAVPNSLSPTRTNHSVSSSVSLAMGRSVSPNTKLQVRSAGSPPKGGVQGKVIPSPSSPAKMRKTCMCSPTTHPGSFRCSLHRKNNTSSSSSSAQSQLNARRSAMANSLVRIGSVEGEWVKRALTALIRPSSHHMRRRTSFQPRPSRLRHMSRAEDFS
jgi:hypothetical protein